MMKSPETFFFQGEGVRGGGEGEGLFGSKPLCSSAFKTITLNMTNGRHISMLVCNRSTMATFNGTYVYSKSCENEANVTKMLQSHAQSYIQ